jgi:hypothetical protein
LWVRGAEKRGDSDVLYRMVMVMLYCIVGQRSREERRLYLPLHAAHSCTLSVHGLVGEPQTGVHVLDITHGVPILDIRNTHTIHLLLWPQVQLFLDKGMEMRHDD